MLRVLRDPKAPVERRDEMAKAAAPYIHARLAALDARLDLAARVEVTSPEERQAIAEHLLDRAFSLLGGARSPIIEAEAIPAPAPK